MAELGRTIEDTGIFSVTVVNGQTGDSKVVEFDVWEESAFIFDLSKKAEREIQDPMEGAGIEAFKDVKNQRHLMIGIEYGKRISQKVGFRISSQTGLSLVNMVAEAAADAKKHLPSEVDSLTGSD